MYTDKIIVTRDNYLYYLNSSVLEIRIQAELFDKEYKKHNKQLWVKLQ